jgi:hypothetical protein
MAWFRPAMGCRLGSTPSPRVLLREAPDRLGRSLPIVRCCLGRGELSNVTERTYVAMIQPHSACVYRLPMAAVGTRHAAMALPSTTRGL